MAVVQRQEAVRSSRVRHVEQTYGPNGIALFSAAGATLVPGELLCLIGLLLPARPVGWVVLAVGAALVLASTIRLVGGITAGRRFRAGRADPAT